MSQAKALKLQLDTLWQEKEQLEAENAWLQKNHTEGAEMEVQSLQEKLEVYERKEQKWEDTATQIWATIDQLKMTAELEQLRDSHPPTSAIPCWVQPYTQISDRKWRECYKRTDTGQTSWPLIFITITFCNADIAAASSYT